MKGFFKNEEDSNFLEQKAKRPRVFDDVRKKVSDHEEDRIEVVVTPCHCKLEGKSGIFCERHRCPKTPSLVKLCQQRQDYFDLWENHEGPMQDPVNRIAVEMGENRIFREEEFEGTEEEIESKKKEKLKKTFFMGDPEIPLKSRGLGDPVAKFTKCTGLKTATKAIFGFFGKDCGCSERQAKLNRMFPYKGSEPIVKTKGFFE